MMQWMPLAQGKNVGPHFDLALAAGRRQGSQQTSEAKASDRGMPIPLTLRVQRDP